MIKKVIAIMMIVCGISASGISYNDEGVDSNRLNDWIDLTLLNMSNFETKDLKEFKVKYDLMQEYPIDIKDATGKITVIRFKDVISYTIESQYRIKLTVRGIDKDPAGSYRTILVEDPKIAELVIALFEIQKVYIGERIHIPDYVSHMSTLGDYRQ